MPPNPQQRLFFFPYTFRRMHLQRVNHMDSHWNKLSLLPCGMAGGKGDQQVMESHDNFQWLIFKIMKNTTHICTFEGSNPNPPICIIRCVSSTAALKIAHITTPDYCLTNPILAIMEKWQHSDKR